MRADEYAGIPAERPVHEAESHHEIMDEATTDTPSASEAGEHEKPDEDYDGHRPALYEIRTSQSRSRAASATGVRPGLALTVSRSQTIVSRIRSRPVPTFTHPLARVQTTNEVVVEFDGPDDPYRPLNWPTHKKVVTTMLYGLVTMTATYASSAYSAGTKQVAAEFGVGEEVAILGTTLFLFGFGIGPLLWAPLSEVYGRRVAVLTPMFVAVCFSFGSATAKDFQTLMLTRFFGAFFASAPVTNTGGVLGDLYTPAWRGIAMAGYAMAVVGGPVLGKSF
jgi:DHA1 family multidrug resistance protein-like MFS transporter